MQRIFKILRVYVLISIIILAVVPDIQAAPEVPMRLDVPNFRQDWEPWKTQKYGYSSNEIQMAGCALTSLAMVLKYYGVETDPGELNLWLKDNGGYVYGNAIVWSKVAERGSGIKYIGRQDFRNGADLERIKSEIDNGYPVIAQMSYKGTSHYAVICGYQGDTFYLNDPWYENPGHTIDSVVQQGDIEVAYEDCWDPAKAIKGIVVFRTNHSTPPKVPVVRIRSALPGYSDVVIHPIKMPLIELQIGNPYMVVNKTRKKIDPEGNANPRIVNGSTLLPIRAVIEVMGGTVDWNGQDKKLTIQVQGRTLEMWIGKKTAYTNYWYFEFDVVPQIIDGRTMVPLRAVTEQLGCKVQWDAASQKILLSAKN